MISANHVAALAFGLIGINVPAAGPEPLTTELVEPLERAEEADETVDADPLARGSPAYEAVAEALIAAGYLDA